MYFHVYQYVPQLLQMVAISLLRANSTYNLLQLQQCCEHVYSAVYVVVSDN
jgi:hypothetical protein